MKLGQGFGITPEHLHTVNLQELDALMPAGMGQQPIGHFPTPGKVIKHITSSSEKQQMLKRVYAKYVY
jgi:hypothetical protein